MRLTIPAAIAVLFLAPMATTASQFPPPAQPEADPVYELTVAVHELREEVARLRAEVAELKATRCQCEPEPAPMPNPPVEPVAKQPANAPTRPMPGDGREWVWAVGSHGEYTWITYDPPGHVGDVPRRAQAASSYRIVPQPTYTPPPVCHGPGCGAGYHPPAPAFVPAPAWGGCQGPNCQRRFP